jgi:hypothetical protein
MAEKSKAAKAAAKRAAALSTPERKAQAASQSLLKTAESTGIITSEKPTSFPKLAPSNGMHVLDIL